MTDKFISAEKKTWVTPEVVLMSSACINVKSNPAANESSYIATGGGFFVNPPKVTVVAASVVASYLS